MKLSKGYCVSLSLNAFLIAWVIAHGVSPPLTQASSVESRARVSTDARPGAIKSPAVSARAASAPVTIGGDWRTWIEPLRRAGVPAAVLVTLVREDFERRWKVKNDEAQREYQQGMIDLDGLGLLTLEHDTALDGEIRAALGADGYRRWDMDGVLQGFNLNEVSLSDAERSAIYDLECQLRENSRDAQRQRLQGDIDQATVDARQRAADEEVQQSLRTLLGDRRAAQLAGEDATDAVRRSLADIPVSEAQLQEIADLQRRWDKTRSDLTALETSTQDAKYTSALQDGEENWRADLQRIIGPDGLDRYLRAQDTRYVDMQKSAGNWNFSPGDVDRVYDTIANAEDTVREYSREARSRNVDPASLEATVKQFAAQTEQSLRTELGTGRYEQLQRDGIALVPMP